MSYTRKNIEVRFGRALVSPELAKQLRALSPGLRGRVIGFILSSYATGVDLQKVAESAANLSKLVVLLNQSDYKSEDVAAAIAVIHNLKL